MTGRLLNAVLLFALVTGANVANAAAPQTVAFPSGNQTVQGLLYLPTSGAAGGTSAKHPAIIVIHEWWGLVDWVKEQADGFASQGYVTLAVDLYRGQTAQDPEMAHELMRGLPQDRGIRDLVAAVAYLKQRKEVDPARIGAVGWCMGGGFAVQLAIAEPSLRAVAINYGSLPTDPAALRQIKAAVLGNFGGLDHGIPPSDVQTFASTLKGAGKNVDVKIYPDAGHAFENPGNKTGYRSGDAEDAQERTRNFFLATLKK